MPTSAEGPQVTAHAAGPPRPSARDGSRRESALAVAGWSTLACVLLCLALILEHLVSYTRPQEQKWIIVCILMVPVYAVCSFWALWAFRWHWLLLLVRDCYEAAAIYGFSMYLVESMGGEELAVAKLSRRLQDMPPIRGLASFRSFGRRSQGPSASPGSAGPGSGGPGSGGWAGSGREEGSASPPPPIVRTPAPPWGSARLVEAWPRGLGSPPAALPWADHPGPVPSTPLHVPPAAQETREAQRTAALVAAAKGQLEAASVPVEVHEHPAFLSGLLSPWPHGKELVTACKFGVVQYMVLKTSFALLRLVLDPLGRWKEGEVDLGSAYPYMAAALNMSQCWALYCVLVFYHAAWPYLAPIKPLSKLLLLKGVVFVTFWQSLLLVLLFDFGLLHGPTDDIALSELFQNALQDFLCCLEMLVAGVAALWVFPAEPYRRPGAPQGPAAWLPGGISRAAAPVLALLCGPAHGHPGSSTGGAGERGAGSGQQRRVTAGRVRVLGNMADLLAPLAPDEVLESEIETGPAPAPGAPGSILLGGWGEEYQHPPGHGATPVGSSLQEVVQGGTRQVAKDVMESLGLVVQPMQERLQHVRDRVRDGLATGGCGKGGRG